MRICKFTLENQIFLWFSFFSVVGPIFAHHYSGQKCGSFLKMNKGTHNICTGWHVTFLPHFQWQFFFFWLVLFLAIADFVNKNFPFFFRQNWSYSSVILRSCFFFFHHYTMGHISLKTYDDFSWYFEQKNTKKRRFFGLYYIVFWEQNRIYDKK